MLGTGDPDASQNNSRFEPSGTVLSWETFVKLAGATRNIRLLNRCNVIVEPDSNAVV